MVSKKIKVYLQTPLKTSDSLYYKNILEIPPKDVEYETNVSCSGIITNKKKFFINNLKNFLRKFLEIVNHPILNLHKTPERDIGLIHCAHCLPITDKNWIADFEAPWQFWISGRDTEKGKKKFLEIVKRDNCKTLLAWTEEAANEMKKKFPETAKKVKVMSYSMPFIKSKKINKRVINLLFSARYFYAKGGLDSLEAIDQLTKKYENVKGIIVSNVPENIKKNYEKNKKIKFYNILPQEVLYGTIYPSSDIFIYPGYSDTFGFGFVEAMNFGLPIVTVDGYARKEIVRQGKTGFVIPETGQINPYKCNRVIISEMIKNTEKIINNKKLSEAMSKNCIEEIKEGKFSIKERNKKLRRIYEEAIR